MADDGNTHIVSGELQQSGSTVSCGSIEINDLSSDGGSFGISGLFAVFLLVVSMALFFAGDGEIQLAGASAGIVAAWILGILNFPWTVVSAIIIFCIIIVLIGRYGRRPK